MKKIISLLSALVLMSAMTVQTFAMQIFVKDYGDQAVIGTTITLEVEPTDTVAATKAKILENVGVAVKQQKLFFGDTELSSDDQTLEDYGIGRESTLRLDVSFTGNTMDGGNQGTYYIWISGSRVSGSAPADVVSVDIAWDVMSFTYTGGSLGTWDPETHSYINGTEGGWSDNKPSITVTNHSNVEINADFAFTAESGVTTVGTFYTKGEGDTFTPVVSADGQSISLASAVGTQAANAPVGTLYFGVSGDAVGEDKALGNITISIKKSLERAVKTEAELNAAIAALKTTGGTIVLTSDLTLTDPVQIPEGAGTSTSPLIIDFGGKTVNGRIAIVGTNTSRSYVTLKNGCVDYLVNATDTTLRDDPAQAAVYAKYTDLKLENLDIWSYQLALRTSTGTKTLIEGEDVGFNAYYQSGSCDHIYDYIAIYNTSSEGFTLSATNDGGINIMYYIVSNYAITLKAGGAYYFSGYDELVPFEELDSDTDIGYWKAYPGYDSDKQKNIRIVLRTNYVTTE